MGACFSIFSVVEVEDAVAAVGGFEWGGVGASSFSKHTLEGVPRSGRRLASDGTDVVSVVGGLRIAITTESSSAESKSGENSLLIGGAKNSFFGELRGPDDFWD